MMIHRKWVRSLRRLFESKAIVLMYHRVASLPADPWQLAVRPNHFEEQLQVLQKKYKVIPLQQLVRQLNNGSVKANTVCITFDDGYRDNFLHAKPLLEQYECPATFFIVTKYIDRKQLFWWDELQHIVLDTPVLPAKIAVNVNDVPFIYDLQEDAVLNLTSAEQQKNWIAPDDPPTRRCELYVQLWQRLKPLPEIELQDRMMHIRVWAGYDPPPEQISWPLTTGQLKSIAQHPLFDIGLHTVTHPSLMSHGADMQCREIMDNRDSLKNICHHFTDILTYPYGDYNDTTIRVVEKENLSAAFTTHEKVITKRSHLYSLGRFQVKDWNGHEFEAQLSRWTKQAKT